MTENFLRYLRDGELPAWEVPNMLTKYATIMQAYNRVAPDTHRTFTGRERVPRCGPDRPERRGK